MTGLSHKPSDWSKVAGLLAPVAGTGSYQNGAWVDRLSYGSALAEVLWSTSGGVTGGTVKFKIEDATDGSGTGAATYQTEQTVNIPAGPNASGVNTYDVDLRGARQFVRISVDADPTGGTPASIVAAALIFNDPHKRPAP
jgi:hypothetical protein